MLSKVIDEALVQKAKHILNHAKHPVLISHMGPDGDAMGSSLGLADFLREQGKQVQVLYPDAPPAFLNWMPGVESAIHFTHSPEACIAAIEAADAFVLLDFNTSKRMAGLAPYVLESRAKKILIDHHPGPDDFADVILSYPNISSTSELVFRYICRAGCFDEMSLSTAECLYTGMMTDTGAFTYNSNGEEIYFIISQLIRKGVKKDRIYDRVFNTYSADRMRLMGFVLYSRMRILDACHSAIIHLSTDDLKGFDYQVGDTEGFVNLPLSISGIYISIFARQEENRIRLSFRSKGSYPVNQLAAELFGGGGHVNAAGAEFSGSMEEAIARIEAALPDFLV